MVTNLGRGGGVIQWGGGCGGRGGGAMVSRTEVMTSDIGRGLGGSGLGSVIWTLGVSFGF